MASPVVATVATSLVASRNSRWILSRLLMHEFWRGVSPLEEIDEPNPVDVNYTSNVVILDAKNIFRVPKIKDVYLPVTESFAFSVDTVVTLCY